MQVSRKKYQHKLRRHQHNLEKQSGVKCINEPSKFIAICNAGQCNGLSYDIIFEHFCKFGNIEAIILPHGKSYSFVCYSKENSGFQAVEAVSGKLDIGQNNKPIYTAYVDAIPSAEQVNYFYPKDLVVVPNFISDIEEQNLLEFCIDKFTGDLRHRQVVHFGYEFMYGKNSVDKSKPLGSLPVETHFLWSRLETTCGMCFWPDQLTINKYEPGQGIPMHVDTHSAFEDPIVSLSLLSDVVMEFRNETMKTACLLPRRSLTIMSGESRYGWMHGIVPRKLDSYEQQTFKRGSRISFTFRKLRASQCECKFTKYCDRCDDSKMNNLTDTAASHIENMHVKQVYDNIANHFSETRNKLWRNVEKFVESFAVGSIVIDLGCGNGKYLSVNNSIFKMGCDSSRRLLDLCRDRQFEVFEANCLFTFLRSGIADGIICIAVIHHLSTAIRRRRAILEIVRVLRLNGRALIYVWAKNQYRNDANSAYINQDRKNRKTNDRIVCLDESTHDISFVHDSGFSLPVHQNRTDFMHADLLVPWKHKSTAADESSASQTFLRYYHVFEETELLQICQELDHINILNFYYDQGNWCAEIQKQS